MDRLGTTRNTYDAAGQLLTEDGPFTSDTVTNTYSNRRRLALSLQQPTGAWTNGFGWDLAGRLTNVTSGAGGFSYRYTALNSTFSGRLVQRLSLPNGAAATNLYDPVARLWYGILKSSGGITLDAAYYGYNVGNQRTTYTNAPGAFVHYTYDNIGQLKVADSSTNSEDRGFAYDAAWNLNWLTNNGTVSAFQANVDNELTNVASRALAFDANGNLTNRVTDASGDGITYVYDDENRLIDVQNLSVAYETVFIYDGLGRLRIRQEYQGPPALRPVGPAFGPTAGLPLVNIINYLYDGWRVVQERDSNNVPQASYTRGLDLSGSLEGAGGIGGLLARSHSSSNSTSHAYYHADANGNITCLIDANQTVVASYRYDPFGNTLSQSGSLADANVYRFSSKEVLTNSAMYYYGYRFYDPNLERWPNRDPLGDAGFLTEQNTAPLQLRDLLPPGEILQGPNLYTYIHNDPEDKYDSFGLAMAPPVPPKGAPKCFKPGPCSYKACTRSCFLVHSGCAFGCWLIPPSCALCAMSYTACQLACQGCTAP